jgi:hypothetical protein
MHKSSGEVLPSVVRPASTVSKIGWYVVIPALVSLLASCGGGGGGGGGQPAQPSGDKTAYFNQFDTPDELAAMLGVSSFSVDDAMLLDGAATFLGSEEENRVPGPNAKLSPILTFLGDINWQMEAPNSSNFVWDDQEVASPYWDNALSIGDINDNDDDDFVFNFFDDNIYFFSVTVLDNVIESDETITVELNDGTITVLPASNVFDDTAPFAIYTVYSIQSGIKSVAFNEGTLKGDDIAIYRAQAYAVTLSRAELAIRLVQAIHGDEYEPDLASGIIFTDVASADFAASYIEQLGRDGLAIPCGINQYCPAAEISNSEMARLLLMAKHNPGYLPPVGTGTVFADVDSAHPDVDWIEALAIQGITAGCGGGKFCPEEYVSRAQANKLFQNTF